MTDQRGGALAQPLRHVSVVDAVAAFTSDSDVAAAEAALIAFAAKLSPTVELGRAH